MKNESREDHARLNDRSLRTFEVDLQLTREAHFPYDINGAFTKDDGASFIKLLPGKCGLKVGTSFGTFNVEVNSRSEIALIHMSVEASTPIEARHKVYDAVAAVLDHLSYASGAPILTEVMRIYDTKNQITTIDHLGPERPAIIDSFSPRLFSDLAPIYALYREFKNSVSAYYRLLCLFKIMEGIFGVLRKKAREDAKALGITLSIPKELVPDHPDIPAELRYLIGGPIKNFYDTILQKRYRDVASHFLVQENVVLRVSSAHEQAKFAAMSFLCDLCVRLLIENREAALKRLDDARYQGLRP
jgi:hypothetical protein